MTPPTLTVPPARTPNQRLAALEAANRVRTVRAELKQGIATAGPSGPMIVADIVADPHQDLATMKVRHLLEAVHGWGQHKANRILVAAQVADSKTLDGLSTRQRLVLVRELWSRIDQRALAA